MHETTIKVLLLNPPGRGVYLRDYFCSKVSQADYINHPIDFVWLSGWLREHCEVSLVDAIVDRLSDVQTLAAVRERTPDAIIGLIGSVSYAEDLAFYRRLAQELPPARIILIGDILIDERERRLRELDFVEAFLHDFATSDLMDYLLGERELLYNMTIRDKRMIVAKPIMRAKTNSLALPIPDHRLFIEKRYRYPFVRRRRFATVMTEYGCPYRCTFCVMSTLGWAVRPVANVLAELDSLHKLGIRELFLLDQTFGIRKPRALTLLAAMERYGFGWVCFSRPEVLDDALLRAMKAAGCHTVIMGLESGDQNVLDSVKKDYQVAEIVAGFKRCACHGMRTVATVIIGLPDETETSFERTLALLKEVECDYASFNVAVPRMGTPLREHALATGLVSPDFQIMDQSGSNVAMPTRTLNRQQIYAMKRRGLREFYFNGKYFRRRMQRVQSFDDFRIQLRQGMSLARNYLNM